MTIGSSLTFSAHGWWGKEKNLVAAKNSVRPSEGVAEGGGWGEEKREKEKNFFGGGGGRRRAAAGRLP